MSVERSSVAKSKTGNKKRGTEASKSGHTNTEKSIFIDFFNN